MVDNENTIGVTDSNDNTDKSFIIRMPLETHRKLKLVSYQTNLTMQEIVIDAIQHELYKYEKDIKDLLNIFQESKIQESKIQEPTVQEPTVQEPTVQEPTK